MPDATHEEAVAAADKAADKATDARAAADTATEKADDAAAKADAKPNSQAAADKADAAGAAADKASDKADAADVKAADAAKAVAEHVAAAEPELTLFILRPVDRNEPPFHFANVPLTYIVAAHDEKEARSHTAIAAEPHSAAWLDETLSSCEPLKPDMPGVVARDMGLV
jgi:hypothetical protein